MEYNSQRELLKIAEYGRNIQKMIDHTRTVKEKDKRTKMAKAIVRVMSIMSPQNKDLSDYEQKLWNHLFHMADYQLDVDCPYPVPTREIYSKKPDRISYPNLKIKYKHYGHAVELLIKAAIEKEDGPEKAYLVESIANLMKKFYLTWNRDSVGDQLIYDHLQELSGGKLKLRPDFVLTGTQDILALTKTSSSTHSHKNKKKSGSNHHKSNNSHHKYKRR